MLAVPDRLPPVLSSLPMISCCRRTLARPLAIWRSTLVAAVSLATEIAENSPFGLIATRATLRGNLADRVRAATEHELAEQTRLRKTDDFKEGVKAMAERRVKQSRLRRYRD
jgi:enoyl-CoA hydratase/carnithine racemase